PKDAPLLLVANEFLDALPVRQFQRGDDGAWHERCVGLDDSTGELRFMLDPRALPFDDLLPPVLRDSPPGSIVESSPPVRAVAVEIAARLKAQGGAALFIDYGYASAGIGETLQAIYRHTYADPLQAPGLADLTVHVDFGSFALAARRAGANVHGPVGQGMFLNRLGIQARAAKLKQGNVAQAGDVDQALRRLTAPEAMGTLFKALALTPPESPQPAGFA
ncbi:MAG: SAM-dependent methyltransferase, partial [Ferrovibrio sp.]